MTMVTRSFLGVGLAIACLAVSAADEPKIPYDATNAKALLERAVAVTGGLGKLAKLESGEWETKATNFEVDPPQPRSAKLWGRLPNQFRVDLTTKDAAGKEIVTSRIISGDQGWTVKDGKAVAMDAVALARSRGTFAHKQAVQILVPLLDPRFTLTPLGESELAGRGKTVAGVKASRQGMPDLKLYFDKETGFLIKSEMQDENPTTGGAEAVEMYFSKHRSFGGIMMPGMTETWRDGKKIREVELVDFRPNAAIDPKWFAKP